MRPVQTGDFAVTRRVTLSLVVLLLSLAGHASASGSVPGPLGLAFAAVVCAGLTTVAAGRRRSWAWLTAFLLGTEALLHVIFVVSDSTHAHGSGGMMAAVPSTGMVAGHVVASLVAAVVLMHGEATLRAWSRLLAAAFGAVVPALAPVSARSTPPVRNPALSPRGTVLSRNLARRGPPVTSLT